MTNADLGTHKMPLGVGLIISDSFSILFQNFFKVLILGFLASFVGFVLNGLIVGFPAAAGLAAPSNFYDPSTIVTGFVVSGILNIVVYGFITALLIQLAYDAKLGRSGSIGGYISGALPALLPIAILSIVVSILAAFGAIALIIGALWVYAVFYVYAPAAVIEGTGFSSLGRSATLTKEYRWPIVGLFLLLVIILALLQMVVGGVVGALFMATIDPLAAQSNFGVASALAFGTMISLIYGLGYGLFGIAVALVYARLREIKEGVAVDQIAAVFE